MNEYAILCTLEMMILIDAENEEGAREVAARTGFHDWEWVFSAEKFRVECLGESEVDWDLEEEKRCYREKELYYPGDFTAKTHGE